MKRTVQIISGFLVLQGGENCLRLDRDSSGGKEKRKKLN